MGSDGTVTLAQVAEAAGVSVATASRTLNGSRDRQVREDLRLRVLDAAARLRYSPNTHAQAIARGQTSVVGLIVHDITDPYFSAIASGVIRTADEHELMVMLATTYRDPQRELEFVRMLRSQRARSIVIVGSRFDDRDTLEQLREEAETYTSAGGRMVLVSQRRLPVDTVLVENRSSSRALAGALHELGHRRFAVLAAPSRLLTSTERVRGFRDELAHRGCPVAPDHVYRGAFTRQGGYEAMTRALEDDIDVTCVFATNDVMAVGAIAALRDHGVELPHGMAVAGFDDIETLRDITPALTTVRLPLEQIGSEALGMTLDDVTPEPRTRRIAGEVVLRASTPPAAHMRPSGRPAPDTARH